MAMITARVWQPLSVLLLVLPTETERSERWVAGSLLQDAQSIRMTWCALCSGSKMRHPGVNWRSLIASKDPESGPPKAEILLVYAVFGPKFLQAHGR